jgi:hypothetical protein
MGNLTLDLPIEGVLPFHRLEDPSSNRSPYAWATRVSPRLHWDIHPKLSVVLSPTLQASAISPLTGNQLRFFRLHPDPRLTLSRYVHDNSELRTDIQEAYLHFKPYDRLHFKLGRNYWDNTLQRRFRTWSYAGFTDGNIADNQISLGVGGEIRFFKSFTKKLPFKMVVAASGGYGGRGEAFGLVQGLATFLPIKKFNNSVTVLGGSVGYANYPKKSYAALYAGASHQVHGSGISPGVYLQQGIGAYFDIQIGYGAFLPYIGISPTNPISLSGRQGVTISADFFQKYWGLHANYGRIWRRDLEGVSQTQIENLLEVSGRWMVFGNHNRILNLTLGGILSTGVAPIRYGIFSGIEINIQNFHIL